MKKFATTFRPSFSIILSTLLLVLFSGCQKLDDLFDSIHDHVKQPEGNYSQVNLVANNDEYHATTVDPNLVNAWGLTFSPNGIPWISAEGSGMSTIYNSEGTILSISPVAIPSPNSPTGGHPTGIVFNGSATDFMLSNGQPARFIFIGDDGVLSAWNQAAGGQAIKIRNNPGDEYTGLAINKIGNNTYLYAANFKQGKIEVFNNTFHKVINIPFNDPNLPSGYAPFNINSIGDKLYVTYAKVGANGDEEHGVGLGFVDIYNTNGTFVQRFASEKLLNAPWGVTMAPDGFIVGNNVHNAILVGNFGDGHINAYNWDGTFLGQLRMNNKTLVIDGLWALAFPPSTSSIDPMRLYFTAGPDDEMHGLFGYIVKK